jgi:hypothetical protein
VQIAAKGEGKVAMPCVGFQDVIAELAKKVGKQVVDVEVLHRIRGMNLRPEARFPEILPRSIVCTAEEITRDMVRGKIGRLVLRPADFGR